MEITKLTKEETLTSKLTRRRHDPSPLQEIKRMAMLLEIGESLLITTKDWDRDTPPNCLIQQHLRYGRTQRRFSCLSLKDNSGWLLVRKE